MLQCGFQAIGMQLRYSARVLSVVAYLPHLKYPIPIVDIQVHS